MQFSFHHPVRRMHYNPLMSVPFFIENVIEPGTITTVIGASGSGKTTFVLQCLESIDKHERAFGLWATHRPLGGVWYCALDRSTRELEAKFKAEIPESFRYKGYRNRLDERSLVTSIFRERPPDTHTVVIDGVGFLVEHVHKQHAVGQFFAKLDKNRPQNLAVILVHHTPKTKGSERYGDPREKGMGSGAWCACSGISVVIEKLNAEDITDPYRNVWLCYTDKPDQHLQFMRKDSRLIHLPFGVPADAVQKTWSLSEIAKHFGVSHWEARKIRTRILAGESIDDIGLN